MKLFNNLLTNLQDNDCVGLGNPNAKILFIGKEAGAESEQEFIHGNTKSWKNKVADYSKRYIPEAGSKLCNLNHTWQKYQRLYDCILAAADKPSVEKVKYEITFVEHVFTTELNNLHALTTTKAKGREGFKEELAKRKDIFFKHDFIQQFPIVVIFALDSQYIQTYETEVRDLFQVEFIEGKEIEGDKFWIHHEKESIQKPKLVIHTRQLTNGASNALIDEIAKVIGDFIKKHNIDILV